MYSEAARSIYTVTWLYLRDYPFVEFAIMALFNLENDGDVPFHLYQFMFQQLYQHFRHAHRWLSSIFDPLHIILPPFIHQQHDSMDPVHFLPPDFPPDLPIPILDSEYVLPDTPSLIILETTPPLSPTLTSPSISSTQDSTDLSSHSSMPSLELAYAPSSASSSPVLPDLIPIDATPPSPIPFSPWPDLSDLPNPNQSPSSYWDPYSPFTSPPSSIASSFNPDSFFPWNFAQHIDQDDFNQMETVSTPSSLYSLFYDEIPTLPFPHAPMYSHLLGISCPCSFCANPYAGLARLFHIPSHSTMEPIESIMADVVTWLFN